MRAVTCHTSGCENDGITIEVQCDFDDGEGGTFTTSAVQCGACGVLIDDVVPPLSEAVDDEEGAS